MPDILLDNVDRSSLVMVRAIVVPKTGAAYVMRRMVTVSTLVTELGENAVYKRPIKYASQQASTDDTMTDDASITVRMTLSLAMAAVSGRCGRDAIAKFSKVMPYIVLDKATSVTMPLLAAALMPAVESMLAYKSGTIVVLASIRMGVEQEMAVFRRMSASLLDVENMPPGAMDMRDILNVAQAMLYTLELLACTGGSHNDIKPANILAEPEAALGWAFVVTDFGLCMWNPTVISFSGSREYVCPLKYLRYVDGQQQYTDNFAQGTLCDNSPWWPVSYGLEDGRGLSGGDIWDSYSHEISYIEWVQRSLSGPSDEDTDKSWSAPSSRGRPRLLITVPDSVDMRLTQKAEVERIHTKNDLYAVGVVLARYRPCHLGERPADARRQARRTLLERASHDALFGFAMRLMLGGVGNDNERDNGIWTIAAAQVELERLTHVFETGLISANAQKNVADVEGGGAMRVKMGLPRPSEEAVPPPMT